MGLMYCPACAGPARGRLVGRVQRLGRGKQGRWWVFLGCATANQTHGYGRAGGQSTAPGNAGYVGIFIDEVRLKEGEARPGGDCVMTPKPRQPEIVPPIVRPGYYFFGPDGQPVRSHHDIVSRGASSRRVRAVVSDDGACTGGPRRVGGPVPLAAAARHPHGRHPAAPLRHRRRRRQRHLCAGVVPNGW